MHVCVCACVHACVRARVLVCVRVCVCVRERVCLNVHERVCVCMRACVCGCGWMGACVCECVCVCARYAVSCYAWFCPPPPTHKNPRTHMTLDPDPHPGALLQRLWTLPVALHAHDPRPRPSPWGPAAEVVEAACGIARTRL